MAKAIDGITVLALHAEQLVLVRAERAYNNLVRVESPGESFVAAEGRQGNLALPGSRQEASQDASGQREHHAGPQAAFQSEVLVQQAR
jgi:hypothetical protein